MSLLPYLRSQSMFLSLKEKTEIRPSTARAAHSKGRLRKQHPVEPGHIWRCYPRVSHWIMGKKKRETTLRWILMGFNDNSMVV